MLLLYTPLREVWTPPSLGDNGQLKVDSLMAVSGYAGINTSVPVHKEPTNCWQEPPLTYGKAASDWFPPAFSLTALCIAEALALILQSPSTAAATLHG
jgi:hypothetical protein